MFSEEHPAQHGENDVLKRFSDMVKNPQIAQLRQPGVMEIKHAARSRNIPCEYKSGARSHLTVVRRGDETILFRKKKVFAACLTWADAVDLVNSSSGDTLSLRLRSGHIVKIKYDEFKQFLQDADIMTKRD